MNEKKVFIIEPIYKAETFMDRSIKSVLEQTYQNWELILVDDCSPDSAPEKCDEWKEADARINVIHHSENRGAGGARNSGLEYIKGKNGYIAFLDGDDFWHPKYLEYMVSTLEQEQVDLVWCDVNNTFEKEKMDFADVDFKKNKETVLTAHALLLREDLRIMYSMVWGKLYRRHLWEDVRFDESYHYYEDGATTFKAIYNAKEIVISDAKLYNYFYSKNSATRSEVSEVKLRDGLRTEEDKITFYTKKKEPDLVEMAYVAYLTTVLKIMRQSKEIGNKALRKEMKKLYRKNYMHAVKNPNLAKSQRMKFVVYRLAPDMQRIWIILKNKVGKN